MENLQDPYESQEATVIGVVCFVVIVASLAVAARIYTRAAIIRSVGPDDYMAMFSLVAVIACGFCVAWNTRYGHGRHIYILSEEQMMLYLRTFYVSIVCYNVGLFCIKMTFLLQYYRTFATNKRTRTILIVATIIVGGWSISQLGVQIFICTPVQAFWDPSVQGTCIPNIPQWYINAGGNILTDVMVLTLPLPIIGRLKLGRNQKYMLLGIFCLGFFTVAISFVRIKYLKQTEDATWDNVASAGWSIGEISSGITCACLPTLRPLLARYFPRLGGSASRSTTDGRYATGPTSSSFASKKRQSRPSDESQGAIYAVALQDVEKGFRARDTAHCDDASEGVRSDDMDRTYSVGSRRPSVRTVCFGGRDDHAPGVPPKDGSSIQVESDIRVTSSRYSE